MAKNNQSVISSDSLNHRLELMQKGRAFWLKRNLDAYHRILLLPDGNGPLEAQIIDMLVGNLTSLQGPYVPNQKPLACLAAVPFDHAPGFEWITVTPEEIEGLTSLYSMYEFTDKLIFVSFDQPYGRKLHNLLETGIAEEKELIADIILEALHGKDA